MVLSHVHEGLRWASAVLDCLSGTPPADVRAKALVSAGILAGRVGDARARVWLEQSVTRAVGGSRVGDALWHLALGVGQHGEPVLSRHLAEESVPHCRADADALGVAMGLHCLGYLAVLDGDDRASRGLLEESIQLSRKVSDKHALAGALHTFGRVMARQRHVGVARRCLHERMALWEQLGTTHEIASVLAS